MDLQVEINGEDDIVRARQAAREVARQLGFGLIDQSRVATAVSELTRNVVRYANGGYGEMLVRHLNGSQRIGMEIVVRDEGPGIEDIDLVMQPGVTSGNGMGLGLPGTKRLMDEMTIDSGLGRGTTVTVRKWRK